MPKMAATTMGAAEALRAGSPGHIGGEPESNGEDQRWRTQSATGWSVMTTSSCQGGALSAGSAGRPVATRGSAALLLRPWMHRAGSCRGFKL